MREFIISTETNNDLSEEFLAKNNVLVIPHYYNVEEKMYGEEDNRITVKEFYDEMRAGKKVGTAASNPAVILDRFTEIAKAGKDIIHISFSSELSAGYQNIVNGANEVMEDYPDCKIIVIDTKSASLGEGILIQRALERQAEGKSVDEVAKELNELAPHLATLFSVENLEYLYRGGRLSKTSAVIGNMISLNPVLHVNDEGKLVPMVKVRGRKKAYAAMLDAMDKNIGSFKDKQVFIGIMHGDCEEDALKMKAMIEEKFGYKNFVIEPIGPSIGAHSGPGTIGLTYLADIR